MAFAAIRAIQVQRLNQQDLATLVAGVLLSGRQVPHHAPDQHARTSGAQMDGIDDADDRGIGGRFLGEERKAGFLAADPVDDFARARPGAIRADQLFSGVFESRLLRAGPPAGADPPFEGLSR
jgi:hypothetical protein